MFVPFFVKKIPSLGCNPCGEVFVFVGKWHIKFETKFLQLKNTAVLNKEREKNMKNFLKNMAALIIAVAMNMAALIIAVAMFIAALIVVVAMVTLFIAVVWMNRWFLIKRAIVILAYTAAIVGLVALLLHLSNKKGK